MQFNLDKFQNESQQRSDKTGPRRSPSDWINKRKLMIWKPSKDHIFRPAEVGSLHNLLFSASQYFFCLYGSPSKMIIYNKEAALKAVL